MTPFTTLINELRAIHTAMTRVDDECAAYLNAIPADQRPSARNLLHYLALRRHDLRQAQGQLASQGLSSLGRTESHVCDSLETVLRLLHTLEGAPWDRACDSAAMTKDAGEVPLGRRTSAKAQSTRSSAPVSFNSPTGAVSFSGRTA